MELFSHRKGIKKIKKVMQKTEWDEQTVNDLWNLISSTLNDNTNKEEYFELDFKVDYEREYIKFFPLMMGNNLKLIWKYLFSKREDEYHDSNDESIQYSFYKKLYEKMKKFFLTEPYNKKLDFIELFCYSKEKLILGFNEKFKKNLLPYRIIKGKIVEIDNEEEYKEIEQASEINHITKAINFLYDKKNPDYKNSIKESISAVEQVCKEITQNPKGKLKDCLDKLKEKEYYHPAFLDALKKLYGFTSDKDGIRHSNYGDNDLPTTYECAKFMLVICSAFVNYLKEKSLNKKRN